MKTFKIALFSVLVGFAVVTFSSCDKRMDEPMASATKANGISESVESSLRAQSGISYEAFLEGVISVDNAQRYLTFIPAKTCLYIKLTDDLRRQYSNYNVWLKHTGSSGNIYLQRYRKWGKNTMTSMKIILDQPITMSITVSPTNVVSTNGTGSQFVTGDWFESDYQWIRFYNPNDYGVNCVINIQLIR